MKGVQLITWNFTSEKNCDLQPSHKRSSHEEDLIENHYDGIPVLFSSWSIIIVCVGIKWPKSKMNSRTVSLWKMEGSVKEEITSWLFEVYDLGCYHLEREYIIDRTLLMLFSLLPHSKVKPKY